MRRTRFIPLIVVVGLSSGCNSCPPDDVDYPPDDVYVSVAVIHHENERQVTEILGREGITWSGAGSPGRSVMVSTRHAGLAKRLLCEAVRNGELVAHVSDCTDSP